MRINYIKKYLSNEDLDEIRNYIADVEKNTSGEIRLCFLKSRAWVDRKLSPRDLAMKEFYRLGMDKTEHKTGVLLLILFSEKCFEIVADEGINSKINRDKWDIITGHLSTEFRNGNYKSGILKGLEEIKYILENEFPRADNDKNELSDDIIIE